MMKSATPGFRLLGAITALSRVGGSASTIEHTPLDESRVYVYMYATRIPISTFGCHT